MIDADRHVDRIGEAAPVDEGEDVPADIDLHGDGERDAEDVVGQPAVDRLLPRFAPGRPQQDADHDHQRDVHRPVQVALGLAEIGGVEVEDGKGNADHGDHCRGDGGVGDPALADQEGDAAFVGLRRRGGACRHVLFGCGYRHSICLRHAVSPPPVRRAALCAAARPARRRLPVISCVRRTGRWRASNHSRRPRRTQSALRPAASAGSLRAGPAVDMLRVLQAISVSTREFTGDLARVAGYGISISGDLVLPTCMQIDDGMVRPPGQASGWFRRQGRAAKRPNSGCV